MSKRKRTDKENRGQFSDGFYDDLTDTVFLYFDEVTVQGLGREYFDKKLDECCIHVRPDQLKKLLNFLIEHTRMEFK